MYSILIFFQDSIAEPIMSTASEYYNLIENAGLIGAFIMAINYLLKQIKAKEDVIADKDAQLKEKEDQKVKLLLEELTKHNDLEGERLKIFNRFADLQDTSNELLMKNNLAFELLNETLKNPK